MNRSPSSLLAVRAMPRGFTMVELLVVVAIVAIGAALALPDLGSFLRRNRVQSATSELISAVSRARVEAARTGAAGGNGQGVPYTVCASANSEAAAPTCTAAPPADGWTAGAIVFADADGNGSLGAGETLVLSIPPAPANLTVTLASGVTSGAAIPYVLFAPNGKLHGRVSGIRFTVAAAGSPASENRYVCLQGGGRPTELSHTTLTTDPRYAACAAL